MNYKYTTNFRNKKILLTFIKKDNTMAEELEVIEMFVNENDEESGVFAVSVVENPAIESSYVALSKQEIKLAEVDKKRQILMGALLIPDKEITRVDDEGKAYAIKFSTETLSKIILLYMRKSKQNNTTEEHEVQLDGNTVMEIWQKEHMVHDKSAMHNLNDPIGSIMITMYVPDAKKYADFVANKNGFSLEGNFTSQFSLKKVSEPCEDAVLLQKVKDLLEAEEQK